MQAAVGMAAARSGKSGGDRSDLGHWLWKGFWQPFVKCGQG